jgi:hypothetical protein
VVVDVGAVVVVVGAVVDEVVLDPGAVGSVLRPTRRRASNPPTTTTTKTHRRIDHPLPGAARRMVEAGRRIDVGRR